jgi:hypothetical protein
MSEHIQTSVGGSSGSAKPPLLEGETPPAKHQLLKISIGLVSFAIAILWLRGASEGAFSYIKPGMSRWFVETIVGRPGNFASGPNLYDNKAVWQRFRQPPPYTSQVSRWLTDSLAGVVYYDASGEVLDVQYRQRHWWDERPEPLKRPRAAPEPVNRGD